MNGIKFIIALIIGVIGSILLVWYGNTGILIAIILLFWAVKIEEGIKP